jgi:dTDP-4-dehydrorhamnose reductase
MNRILVIGKSGQLGKSIHKLIADTKQAENFIFVGRKEIDFCDKSMIENYFKDNSYDIIINCAAYTGVDKAEEEEEIANQVNHLAVLQLAHIVKKQRAKFIHISTDYVFDGRNNNPYKETDKTNPINVYGKTKLKGEKAIQKILPYDAIIIRVSWMYSEYGNNFVKTIMRLGKERKEINVVNDQVGSPTYATDLANLILKNIKYINTKKNNFLSEIYHFSNEDKVSWYEFAKEIIKTAKLDCKVNAVSSQYYQTLAKRPNNSTLDTAKIFQKFKLDTLNLSKSLEFCISILKGKE